MIGRRGVPLWACALLATGCGYGLHQTAKTQRPGTVSLQTGLSYVSNEVLSAQSSSPPTLKFGGEVGPLRVGLSDHVDMGFGLFYVTGVRVDSKFNVMPRENPLAIAPRIGAGFATNSDRSTTMWMAGVIGSYDVTETLTPYLSATFANHWFASPQPVVDLGQGERLAPATGFGDGLLQLVGGIQWRPGSVALSAEYGRWLPMQNDPGTYFAFVATEVVSLGVRFCFERRCE
jgi:hypothetical protein